MTDSTALVGQLNGNLMVAGTQQLAYGGQPLVSSIGIRGSPTQIPDGYRAVDRAGAVDDLLRPLGSAVDAITLMAALLWVAAALIVGSVIYLSALERTHDFAVFKAVGVATGLFSAGSACRPSSSRSLCVLGGLFSLVLGPIFPMRVVVPTSAFLLLPVIAVLIGLVPRRGGGRW